MSGTNDFLPIAIAGGAPVQDQATYVASTPANGRGAGILPKEVYNKMFRQSSSMAAMLGLFISNAGGNALDDGNIANLEAAFIAALGASGYVPLSDFTGAHQQLGSDGWQDFPGGLIVQWVHATISGPSWTDFSWPKPFPTSVFGGLVTANGAFMPTTSPTLLSKSLTGGRLDCASGSDSPDVFIVGIGK